MCSTKHTPVLCNNMHSTIFLYKTLTWNRKQYLIHFLFIIHLSHNVYNFIVFIFQMQHTQIHSFMCSMCKKLTYLSINAIICSHVHTAPFTQHSVCLSSDLPTTLFSRNLTPVLLNTYCICSDGVTTYFSSV